MDQSYIPEDYNEDQTNFDLAMLAFKKELNVADQEQIDKQISLEPTEEMKHKWVKYFERQNTSVIKEACLHHVGGVKGIKWIPEDTRRPRLVDPVTKRLLGKYVLEVRRLDLRDDGDPDEVPTFELYPASDWVEKHIQSYYLATAQKIAIDFWEQVSPVDQRHIEHGYIDVSDQRVKVPLDTEPINKLRYIPERHSKIGKNRIAAQWYGYCKKSMRKVPLDEAYVLKEFSPNLVKEVKKIGLDGEKYFIGIPPGDAKPSSEFPSHLEKGPEMKYKQGEEKTCLVYSCASTLHYLGAK